MTLARTRNNGYGPTLWPTSRARPPAGTDALFWNGSADHASTDKLDQT